MCSEQKHCELRHLKALIKGKFALFTVRNEILENDRLSMIISMIIISITIFSDVYKRRVEDDTARELRFKSLIEEFCVHLFGEKKSLVL